MYLGYQNGKIKFYTEKELSKELYNIDNSIYTEDEYVLDGDEYVLKDERHIAKQLEQAKQAKIQENDLKRDEALNQGVEYKGVLFDSDTDQKVNLIAIVSTISETDLITWFGKDNQPLECNKEDLINIGSLITQLHTFCWNKNAQIKALINEAQTIQEVEAIVIDYTMPEPDLVEQVEEEESTNG